MIQKIKKITEFIKHKLIFGFGVIKTYKNWPICFLDYFGFLKNRELIYYLRNGIKYKAKGSSGAFQIINETWILNHYLPNSQFAIKDNFILIDIGANIDSFSVFAGKSAKNVKVFSYEPVKENLDLLKENIKINNLENNIYASLFAVAGFSGKKKIYLDEKQSSRHSFYQRKVKNYFEVECTTLENIFKSNKIEKCDFLKTDVEGAEYEILFNTPEEILKKSI
jgi:FkbM family methyltransferase